MKRTLCVVGLIGVLLFTARKAQAQLTVAEIIKKAVTKVIVAIDLKVQRLQNKTIWLQNAQKTLENEMSKLKLTEISEWVEKQKKLYQDYFEELSKVKAAISYYHVVKEILQRQTQMVSEYKQAWQIFSQDKNFSTGELESMQRTYSGMLEESLKNIDQLTLVINAFTTQMSDAARLKIINEVSDKSEETLSDLKEYNRQNKMILVERAAEKGEIDKLKKLHGL